MSEVLTIESVYVHSMLRTIKFCFLKISNHVAHLLLYMPEVKDHVWINHTKCWNSALNIFIPCSALSVTCLGGGPCG